MAPSKVLADDHILPQVSALAKITGRMSTRNQNNSISSVFNKKMNLKDLSKRKADQLSPPKGKTVKRSAFGDLTNATNNQNVKKEDKKVIVVKKEQSVVPLKKQQSVVPLKKETVKILTTAQLKLPIVHIKKLTVKGTSSTSTANAENVNPKTGAVASAKLSKPVKEQFPMLISKDKIREIDSKFDTIQKVTSASKVSTRFRRSLNSSQDKSDESSLYTSALEDVSPAAKDTSLKIITPTKQSIVVEQKKSPCPPPGVADFDLENLADPIQVSNYAMDIFQYMKDKEAQFVVHDYLSKQVLITKWMRCLLVDWMVEVQENFELNHETLYLAVKITDMYLSKVMVSKEVLQLVGTAALFIASKYDERLPPLIDDFIYTCENAFTRDDVIHMEMDVFRVINFNLGIPLSYRFLRRYARCCKANMPILTLARYILELSLMEYEFIFLSESKVACAALYLALRMKDISRWTPCLEYYTGYKLDQFTDIAKQLNAMLRKKPREQLKTVRNKYSHQIFFEVAKVPLIEDTDL